MNVQLDFVPGWWSSRAYAGECGRNILYSGGRTDIVCDNSLSRVPVQVTDRLKTFQGRYIQDIEPVLVVSVPCFNLDKK